MNRIYAPHRWFIYFLLFIILASICRDFLVGDKPIIQYSAEEGVEFPAFANVDSGSDNTDYKWRLMPLVPHNPEKLSSAGRPLLPPLSSSGVKASTRHWLGTDNLGRDVLAGVIYGCRIAIIIGLISGLISMLLGYILGAIAGYYGDNRFRINGIVLLGIILLSFLYAYYQYWTLVKGGGFSLWLFLLVLLCLMALYLLGRKYKKPSIQLPVDTIIMRSVDFFSSLPALLILLVISVALHGWNVVEIAVLIGILRWPTLCRHVRAELIHLRETEEVEYTKGLGFSDYYILTRRILMRSIQPALVVVAFVTASSIVLEATLSFLGLGLPAETISWGNIIYQSRAYPDAWWLVVFPGIMLFLIVYGLNQWGRKLNRVVHQATR